MERRNRISKQRTWAVERLESRHCMASWYQYLTDTDVKPSAVAQFIDPDSIAVLGSSSRVEGNSRYADGVALEISPTGRMARANLPSIDASLPFPSEVWTLPNDAEFDKTGTLFAVGSSASDLAAIDTQPLSHADGEPSVWSGSFDTQFMVEGIGFPDGAVRQGDLEDISLRNGDVVVGNIGFNPAYSQRGSVPNLVLRSDGLPIRGLATATNGYRILVSAADSSLAYFYEISATGDLGSPTELERPEDVFRVFGIAMSDNGWMSGFGQVFEIETNDTTTVTLVWRPNGTLAKRIEVADQLVESRVIADGVVFYELNPNFGFLGNQGNYVYLTATDTSMLLKEWMQSLGLIIQLTPDQRVVDAEWSFNGEWLNILVASNVPGESMVIHLDDSDVRAAARPWTNPDNYLNVNDDAGSLVTPIDALLILSKLNQQTDSTLPYPRPVDPNDSFYYDTSKDGFLTALDALLVINELNSPTATLAIGEYDIPPVELPVGFKPMTSLETKNGDYLVAGSYNDVAAYLSISKTTDGRGVLSQVAILPSLDIAAGGTKSAGLVREILYDYDAKLEFIGSSKSNRLVHDPGAGEATVWDEHGTPTGLGFLPGAVQSQASAGSRNGFYVGESRGNPILFTKDRDPQSLPGELFGGAIAISDDGLVIAGGADTKVHFWTSKSVGAEYELKSVSLPDSGFDNGAIQDMAEHWMVGIYFSETVLDYVGAVWDSRDGSLIHDFVDSGPVIYLRATKVGESEVLVANPILNGSPYLYFQGDTTSRNVNGLLPNLTWGTVIQVPALVDGSRDKFALTALTSSGIYIFASLKTTLKPRG